MPPDVLERLDHLRGERGGGEWIDSLPLLLERCVARWSLEVGDPYPDGVAALVLPASSARWGELVLKISFPHRESEHEAAALDAWAGDGAVRLIDHDEELHALLVERCVPGTHLSTRPADEALDVLVGLLPRLWRPAPAAIHSVADEARWWRSYAPTMWERTGRPFELTLLDAALEQMEHLSASQDDHEQVLLHQDLHADNVLAATREPWLVIDPKPLVGERAFAAAPIVRSFELGHGREQVEHRLRTLAERLDLDRERAWGWSLAQTVAWCFGSVGALAEHLETARWLMELR